MVVGHQLNLHKIAIVLFLCTFVVLMYQFFVPKCLKISDSSTDFNEYFEEVRHNEFIVRNEFLKYYFKVDDPVRFPRVQQRGEYWVFYNYVRSSKIFAPDESITYTTHGDFTFLDNLVPLLERWLGPVSIALYAPGDDFQRTFESIRYLRDCTSTLVGELVTFHIYFRNDHFPNEFPPAEDLLKYVYDCNISSPHQTILSNETYKAINKLPYPVNVARNIAKETSQTHFVLASDVELYPSLNIIPNFLEMIRNNSENFGPNPAIYPLNIFEVTKDSQIPGSKTQLKQMLKQNKAITFHKKVCPKCHNTPRSQEWIEAKETEGLHVFHIGKRLKPFEKWEPIYIGTKNDPPYDERLTWEGKSDKMTQGYILCVKDYNMMILDNAFLVHKPGIKVYKEDPERSVYVRKTNEFLTKTVIKELKMLYGSREGCGI